MAAKFASTDHLSAEAVAALVDGELAPSAERRAKAHLAQCTECLADAISQQRAAERLRRGSAADAVHAPSSLIERLARLAEAGPAGPAASPASPVPASSGTRAWQVGGKVESALRKLRRRG